ncbi:MAG: SDR family oxidoreductase [Sphingomicrobium sp.]
MPTDFSGRVAIVTGAAAGLGRAHALWLARHGCAVVVNNRPRDGKSRAQAVVDEIVAAGGRAIAHDDVVETETAGRTMVASAIDQFGRIDILVCNAGVQWFEDFNGLDLAANRAIIDVSLWGSLYPVHAAWPHMVEQGYGRVVLTGSGAGQWGQIKSVPYCTAKAAMIGIARGLTLDVPEGADIRANVIAPVAYTSMSNSVLGKEWSDFLSPDYVARIVGWLASEACQESGMIYHCGAGRVRRVRLVESPAVEVGEEDIGMALASIASGHEPASSFAAGAELIPEFANGSPPA